MAIQCRWRHAPAGPSSSCAWICQTRTFPARSALRYSRNRRTRRRGSQWPGTAGPHGKVMLMDASAWAALRADLAAESRDLDGMLAGLGAADWERGTPAEGWAIRDQVSHLAWVDDAAVTALTDPEQFRAETAAS